EKNLKESSSKLCKVVSRILTIPSSLAATERNCNYKLTCSKLESSDMTEAVKHFNNRPSSKNNQFELLDPSSDDEESSRNKLIDDDKNKIVESSESEIELTTENNTDSKANRQTIQKKNIFMLI
ncbi:11582_t:CDS:2, partial [Gigaspora margarita]